MENVAAILTAINAGQLRIRCTAVWDWYDGPLEGIAEIDEPRSFWYFRIIGEHPSNETVDDRLFALSALPADVARQVSQDEDTNPETEQAIAAITATPPALFIQSRTFATVERAWRVSVHEPERPQP